jgi:hypothetical protein
MTYEDAIEFTDINLPRSWSSLQSRSNRVAAEMRIMTDAPRPPSTLPGRFIMPQHPAGEIGPEQTLHMDADRFANRQKRSKFILARSANPPAPIRYMCDVIEVAADGPEFGDRLPKRQQLFPRKG